MTQPPRDIESLKKGLGASSWSLLHTVAATYPDKPSLVQQRHIKQFFHRVAEFYPCRYCAADFRESIKKHPVRTENKEVLSVWVCERHNEVNEKLGKPIMNCDKIWEKWGALHAEPLEPIDSFDSDDDIDEPNDLDMDSAGVFDDEDCGFCDDMLGKEQTAMMRQQLRNMQQNHKSK
jgi:hypothetical protein